jgi:hypothetical protein
MNAALSLWMRRLDARVSWPVLLAVGGLALFGMWELESWLHAQNALARPALESVAAAREDLELEIADRQSLEDLVAANLEHAKRDAANLSRSRRVLFEGGLALSEEERLLSKQWEIMTTYVLIDPAADRVQIMRGDQIDELLALGGQRERAVGGEKRALPLKATIVSKERYAHTERGKSDQVDGRLDWEPPQVGTSARARALGEDVLFTREGLVIHGPPLDAKEHEAYPHLCLTLPLATARKLYARTFIGTVVLIKLDASAAAKP